jgi:hypothetical protein
MRKSRWVLLLVLAGAFSLSPARGEEITPAGKQLAKVLDQMNVENLWLPGDVVEFNTGKKIRAAKTKVTHCSAFAAFACAKLDVYLLRPPEHKPKLLANAQANWLASQEGKKKGWRPVKDQFHAQHLANEGKLVLAVYGEQDDEKPGHIAVIRPSTKTRKEIDKEGPQIIQAGATNSNSTSAKEGFKHHKGAWPHGIRYYFHDLDWSKK